VAPGHFTVPLGDLPRDRGLRVGNGCLNRFLVSGVIEDTDESGAVRKRSETAQEVLHRYELVATVDCYGGDRDSGFQENRSYATRVKLPDLTGS
jgi:hypothetical protein